LQNISEHKRIRGEVIFGALSLRGSGGMLFATVTAIAVVTATGAFCSIVIFFESCAFSHSELITAIRRYWTRRHV